MRLAYLSTDPGIPYGGTKGAAVHLAEMVSALAGEGNEVLTLVAGLTPGAPAPPPGVTVEVLPGVGKGVTTGERLRSQDGLTAWLVRRLKRFRPAVLYERLALHSAAGSAAAGRLHIPHLVEVNAPLPAEATRYRALEEPEPADRLERAVLARADLVLAVSPPLADYVTARGASRVEVLQNAAAAERFPADGVRNGGPPVAVFVGTLRPWHGMEAIAEAWRRLGEHAPGLLVVGDGPAGSILEGTGATLVGPVPPARIPSLLAGAHIGLAPYSADAPRYFSPIKVFEYLAAGLATVVADLPAVTAVVDDETAVLIPPGDARALADAVADLAADPAKRRRLGENGRTLVRCHHTWKHRARRVIEAAAELTGRSGAPA
jgi:glycosyltransferase involved in cell wall biosynthesis